MKETVLYTGPDSSEAATLYVLDKTEEIKAYKLGQYARIGRNVEGSQAEITLDSSITSRKHGEIQLLGDDYCYTDSDSLNGTFINGELFGKDSSKKGCRLKNGDVIRIDQKNLKFTHPESVLMVFLLGNTERIWKELELTETTGDIEIGRSNESQNSLALKDEALSRKHATFVHGVNCWSIKDHGSTNGVYVNNVRLEAPKPLHRLDVVQIARTTFIFLGNKIIYNVQESNTNGLQIHIAERSVRKNFKKKVLLQDIDMNINSGEMVMILGGSGAGKTTFVNAVMGYEKADAQIVHGEQDVYKDYSKVKHQIGFVPQQNLMRENDIVYDTIMDSAKMKLPGLGKADREKRIDEVLELLGLSREKNTRVGSLSGGQKRRLSIAVEYVSNPTLFFLDEPDSGLDPVMGRELMSNLRTIADDGKIVMVITHAADNVCDLFDKVIVLAKSSETNSGHLAFFGGIDEAKAFFETTSMTGIVKKINRADEGGEELSDFFIKKYEKYKEGR